MTTSTDARAVAVIVNRRSRARQRGSLERIHHCTRRGGIPLVRHRSIRAADTSRDEFVHIQSDIFRARLGARIVAGENHLRERAQSLESWQRDYARLVAEMKRAQIEWSTFVPQDVSGQSTEDKVRVTQDKWRALLGLSF